MTSYDLDDNIVVTVLVVPALIFWIVTFVRANRAKDPRDSDGRRVEVEEEQVLAAQRLNRRAVMLLVVATMLAFVIRIFV